MAESPQRAATSSASTAANRSQAPAAAALRQRLLQRPSSPSLTPPLPTPPAEALRRRSSLLSFSSLDDATQSFSEDLLNPRTARQRNNGAEENEVTHWHSAPLAFAILPALAGLLFKNGATFVTDVFILGLAAVFMNWSIRLPFDWYYSAQALRRAPPPEFDDTIVEEPEPDDVAVETDASVTGSPHIRPVDLEPEQNARESSEQREKAAAELRTQEIMALTATFVFPILAAYFLHVVRAQLSGPSSGLVSDYNLSIFLLAAEIKPVRQLFRLIANRTLHLQRTVTGLEDPFAEGTRDTGSTATLEQRIAELEAKLAENSLVPATTSIAQKTDVTELSAELRKRYEPRLEGLERAVRRYEKRSTTLAMLTEQRLQALENRTNDAFSLAAVAAQHSQSQGIVARIFSTLAGLMKFPLSLAWTVCVWPLTMLEDLYARFKALLVGPGPPSRTDKRGGYSSRHGSGTDDRPSKPRTMPFRKAVR